MQISYIYTFDNKNKTMKKKTLVLASTIMLMLIACIGILGYSLSKQKRQNKAMLELAEMDKKELEDQYQQFADQYGQMRDVITDKSISVQLGLQQNKTEDVLLKLKRVRPHDIKEITHLKKMLPVFKKVLYGYILQVDSLTRINKNLIAENTMVKGQYTRAAHQISGLHYRNSALSRQVKIASLINIDDINMNLLTKRGKTTRRVRRAKSINITFNIAKNLTAPQGERNFVAFVTTPDKETLIAKKAIMFTGRRTPVLLSAFVHNKKKLAKGIYQIIIFANGQRIDKKSFTFK